MESKSFFQIRVGGQNDQRPLDFARGTLVPQLESLVSCPAISRVRMPRHCHMATRWTSMPLAFYHVLAFELTWVGIEVCIGH